ncbi:putative signal transduction protein with CBS domain containing protein [Alkalidesulfovibrio alkalitolerans DSM 16529]|uniref:Putative signal transduction protein with CBS domain containing protein n=1 Tax=Alkalidesulfovibrio alkalitolerans DSM 16529 TaxID=1121439 RepID=S7T4E5_9BACT|nr:CBS domain-containing protein [Alkalidesulfovibrio alkalitolerans]EPR31476.1 putative signal transduction protein with CBS domain containing protein [Alkalidesulfovibrio alkalitolerans DSM 16529]
MYVGLKMLKKFVTATPKTLVKDARRLLEEQRLWMLLVMEGDRLVGYVRLEDIMAALPSIMTTLEKHELNYLLSKLTVEKIIRKDITSVSPTMDIESAAKIMHDKNLAGLAVVDDDTGKLLGYINRSVMLEVLVEEMGLLAGGKRIVFEVADRPGVIHEVSGIIAQKGVSIISTGTFFHENRRMVVIRVATEDESPIAAALQERGYKLVTAADFVGEWL